MATEVNQKEYVREHEQPDARREEMPCFKTHEKGKVDQEIGERPEDGDAGRCKVAASGLDERCHWSTLAIDVRLGVESANRGPYPAGRAAQRLLLFATGVTPETVGLMAMLDVRPHKQVPVVIHEHRETQQ